ncbi:hypothetical protein ABC672_20555, partial [Pseudomonas aeruginosa]
MTVSSQRGEIKVDGIMCSEGWFIKQRRGLLASGGYLTATTAPSGMGAGSAMAVAPRRRVTNWPLRLTPTRSDSVPA